MSTPQPTSTSTPTSYTLLSLGDSYTIGETVSEQERWPVQLAARLSQESLHVAPPRILAQTGWTTDELAQAIANQEPLGQYDLVTLLIGVNNQYRGWSLDTCTREFGQLLATAGQACTQGASGVIAVSIPDWGVMPFAKDRDVVQIARDIDDFNAAQRQVCQDLDITWIDITTSSRNVAEHPEWIASDGLHPSGAMYQSWCEIILPIAKRKLSDRK